MSGTTPLNYWDACIFLAWLKNETRQNPFDMQGVLEQASEADKGDIQIATSAISMVEVLAGGVPNRSEFLKLFQRPNYHLVGANRKIMELAHEVRNYFVQQFNAKATPCSLSTPDAIHVATAIWFKCDRFYTFDGDGKPGLLTLQDDFLKMYSLKVEKPTPKQYILALDSVSSE